MKQISKSDLIDMVSERTGEKKNTASKLVNETFTILRDIMCQADEETRVSIRDFGSFEIKKSEATTGRNPPTNEVIDIPPRMRVRFAAGKYIKDCMKEGK